MEKKKLVCTILLLLTILLSGCGKVDTKEIHLPDQCGRVGSLVSHTIGDEDACRIRCQGQCSASDKVLDHVRFETPPQQCNDCYCTCKERGWFS